MKKIMMGFMATIGSIVGVDAQAQQVNPKLSFDNDLLEMAEGGKTTMFMKTDGNAESTKAGKHFQAIIEKGNTKMTLYGIDKGDKNVFSASEVTNVTIVHDHGDEHHLTSITSISTDEVELTDQHQIPVNRQDIHGNVENSVMWQELKKELTFNTTGSVLKHEAVQKFSALKPGK